MNNKQNVTAEQVNSPVIKNDFKEIQNYSENLAEHKVASTKMDVLSVGQKIGLWSFYLYWSGVIIFSINFIGQLCILMYRAYSKKAIRDGTFRIIELEGNLAPCSFWNYIFINPSKYDWETYNQILLHEKAHATQRHTLDIMIVEMAIIFQWFNPVVWLYRKELESNLEFLTDETVLNENKIDRLSYQVNLLKVSAPHTSLNITNNYNQSLLKRRIIMMNAKKSNVHIVWKYLMLLPLLCLFACVFNEPAAFSNATNSINKKKMVKRSGVDTAIKQFEGLWFATITNEKLMMKFKSTDIKDEWSVNATFLLSELSSIPKDQKGEFNITREAGTVVFRGKFNGDQGYGQYKFVPNNDYIDYLKKRGISYPENVDNFTSFIFDIRKDYIQQVAETGFKPLSLATLEALASFNIAPSFIRYWKKEFNDITINDLINIKDDNIDSVYLNTIRKESNQNVTLKKLLDFESPDIVQARTKPASGSGLSMLREVQKRDSIYSDSVDRRFAKNLQHKEIESDSSMGISSEFIKSFEEVGYDNVPVFSLMSFKQLKITPDYIRQLDELGFKKLSVDNLIALKAQMITPQYIKSFQNLGYADISFNDLISFNLAGVTPDFIKSIQAIGYKNITVNTLVELKSQKITADFIRGFNKLGYNDVPLNEISFLKMMQVTPAYVAEMKGKGFVSKNLNKYIELKSFNK